MNEDEVPTKITTLKSRRKVIPSARSAQQGTLNLFAEHDECDEPRYIITERAYTHSDQLGEEKNNNNKNKNNNILSHTQHKCTNIFAEAETDVEPAPRAGVRRYTKYNSFFTSPESTLQSMLAHQNEEQRYEEEEQENLLLLEEQQCNYKGNNNARQSNHNAVLKEQNTSHKRHYANRTGSASHCGRHPYTFYSPPSPAHATYTSRPFSSCQYNNNSIDKATVDPCKPFLHSTNANVTSTINNNNNNNNSSCNNYTDVPMCHINKRKYNNAESTSTREFPRSGLRHVVPPKTHEPAQGVRHINSARAAKQQIQVVNISPRYKNNLCPATTTTTTTTTTYNNDNSSNRRSSKNAAVCTPRCSIRCMPERRASSQVRHVLIYKSKQPSHCRSNTQQQLQERQKHKTHDGSVNDDDKLRPVGKPSRLHWRKVNSTPAELFLRAVQDHATQRVNGVTGFYVQLARNLIADVRGSCHHKHTTDKTYVNAHKCSRELCTHVPDKVIKPHPWDHECNSNKHIKNDIVGNTCCKQTDINHYNIDDDDDDDDSDETWHIKHVLTLGSCRDQLVALTAIRVTVQEVAEILWPEMRVNASMKNKSNDNNDNECSDNVSNERSFLTPESEMRTWTVTFKDFARAFGGLPETKEVDRTETAESIKGLLF